MPDTRMLSWRTKNSVNLSHLCYPSEPNYASPAWRICDPPYTFEVSSDLKIEILSDVRQPEVDASHFRVVDAL